MKSKGCVEEMMERPAIHGQIRRLKLNPPSPWQGLKYCFLEVMTEWIRVRIEKGRREKGEMDPDLLEVTKCCNVREMVFLLTESTTPRLVIIWEKWCFHC